MHQISAFLGPWDHNGAFDYSLRFLLLCGITSTVSVWQGRRCDTLLGKDYAIDRAFKAAAAKLV
jgi:hypothetical protein